MEPELPTPRLSPERGPAPERKGGEFAPEQPFELAPDQAGERYEQRSEASASAADATSVALPPVAPTPVVDDTPVDAGAQDDDLPAVAADDDLIEKEWVDKAKQILASTKDDPYRREQEISRLQVEYLKKRYGKELGVSS